MPVHTARAEGKKKRPVGLRKLSAVEKQVPDGGIFLVKKAIFGGSSERGADARKGVFHRKNWVRRDGFWGLQADLAVDLVGFKRAKIGG